jgi:hypothetical protein
MTALRSQHFREGEQSLSTVQTMVMHWLSAQIGASAPHVGSIPCVVQAFPWVRGGRRQKVGEALTAQA